MNDYVEANRRHWDECVPIHVRSDTYAVEAFKAGKSKLRPIELEELGDVRGRTLLHLQCHFGLDTLSWAREGAIVTGIDFSQPAIGAARALAAECGIEARFLQSDLYELPERLDGRFDIVFTSYGALNWLPDIPRWAQIAARYVRPGGAFYVVEFHPIVGIFDDAPAVIDLEVRHPYFQTEEPLRWDEDGTYADMSARLLHRVRYEWPHPTSQVLTALIDAGLRIEFFHEFPFSPWAQLPSLMEWHDAHRHNRLKPPLDGCLPLSYSIRATKVEGASVGEPFRAPAAPIPLSDRHYYETNRRHWDELVPVHVASEFYDVEGFKAGRTALKPVELEELADVRGKTLLHLQCHFGLDTLSWAREGAIVTGVDFSAVAIEQARVLAAECGIEARFIVSDVYGLPDVLDEQFDIVYTSYGVLFWLPDIERWAQVVARLLRPGGTFYMLELHPIGGIFVDGPDGGEPLVRSPYFPAPEPRRYDDDGTYADPSAKLQHRTTYSWPHPVSEVVTALIDAGLRIEFFHEFAHSVEPWFTVSEEVTPHTYRLTTHDGSLPLLYSIKATKDG